MSRRRNRREERQSNNIGLQEIMQLLAMFGPQAQQQQQGQALQQQFMQEQLNDLMETRPLRRESMEANNALVQQELQKLGIELDLLPGLRQTEMEQMGSQTALNQTQANVMGAELQEFQDSAEHRRALEALNQQQAQQAAHMSELELADRLAAASTLGAPMDMRTQLLNHILQQTGVGQQFDTEGFGPTPIDQMLNPQR